MPYYCMIPGCYNNSSRNPDISFHLFPKNDYFCNVWKENIAKAWRSKKPFKPSKCQKVCGAHFVGGKKTSRHRIPTLFPYSVTNEDAEVPNEDSIRVEVTNEEDSSGGNVDNHLPSTSALIPVGSACSSSQQFNIPLSLVKLEPERLLEGDIFECAHVANDLPNFTYIDHSTTQLNETHSTTTSDYSNSFGSDDPEYLKRIINGQNVLIQNLRSDVTYLKKLVAELVTTNDTLKSDLDKVPNHNETILTKKNQARMLQAEIDNDVTKLRYYTSFKNKIVAVPGNTIVIKSEKLESVDAD